LRRDRALGSEGWRNAADEPTQDSGLGFYVASLNVADLPRSYVALEESGTWQSHATRSRCCRTTAEQWIK
jgi:hypothetical protein